MLKSWMLPPLLVLAGTASAQIGSQVTGSVRGAIGAGVGTNVATGGLPDAPAAAGASVGSVRGTEDAIGQGAGRTTGDVQGGAGKTVRVRGNASVRVAQGTRCWYERDAYYDPVSRDGSYYCERTGPGAAAGASVGH